MGSLSFLNAPLLWGLALASIPLIIHLLYRRKFRRVDWAPMVYLKLSIQRNRRRIRLEQLLLLLVRTALILLLMFLVARPVLQAAGLGKWLGGTSRASQLLVIDDSLSMGYQDSGRSALARGKELAASIIRAMPTKDRFTLALASQPSKPLVHEVELADHEAVVKLLDEVNASDTLASWHPLLESLDQWVSGAAYPTHEVTLITDLRAAGWEEDYATLAQRWAGNRVRLRIFDVGSRETANISLESLEQADRLAMAGAPVRYEAEIRNGSHAESPEREANWIVDGKPSAVRVAPLAAGESLKLPLTAVFQEAGLHHVELQLASDALSADNQRRVVTQVRDSVHVLLVDGEPSSEPLAGEADFLGLALSLGIGQSDAFRVEVVADNEWAQASDLQPDLLVLANVGNLTQQSAERLHKLVEAGMGLMIFVGEQVDPENYNQVLGGVGLLPARLDTIADEEVTGLNVESSPASPLAALEQLSPAVLQRVHLRKFFQAQAATDTPGVRVLARWNNTANSPAVVERVVGQGHVLLWTVTADKQWSDWPTEPSYVLGVREAARATARAAGQTRQLTAGEPIVRSAPATHEIQKPVAEVPGAAEPVPLVERATTPETTPGAPTVKADKADKADKTKTLVLQDTRRAGLYRLAWQDSQSGPQADTLAVNPDRRESELTRLDSAALRKRWQPLEVDVIDATGAGDATVDVQGQEIWRPLATGLLCLLACEACLATWTGRQR